MKKIKWGVLSTARIGIQKMIPALANSRNSELIAIASGQTEKVAEIAAQHAIPRVYHSYEALLNDPEIDAVYIPVPNHLHIPWTIKALQKGKHVLCEKPFGLSAKEIEELNHIAGTYSRLKVMEAFMYRFHPLMPQLQKLINGGRIGRLQSIQAMFSYYNANPDDIRNKAEIGGGGLLDIGCYCISAARYLFGAEPVSVSGMMKMDENFGTDWLTAGTLHFPEGFAVFTCSTQMEHRQHLLISGSHGHIEVRNPFNPPLSEPVTIRMYKGDEMEEIEVPPANQYTLQCEAFASCILENTEVPISMDDSIGNARVIDAIFESNKTGAWVKL